MLICQSTRLLWWAVLAAVSAVQAQFNSGLAPLDQRSEPDNVLTLTCKRYVFDPESRKKLVQ